MTLPEWQTWIWIEWNWSFYMCQPQWIESNCIDPQSPVAIFSTFISSHPLIDATALALNPHTTHTARKSSVNYFFFLGLNPFRNNNRYRHSSNSPVYFFVFHFSIRIGGIVVNDLKPQTTDGYQIVQIIYHDLNWNAIDRLYNRIIKSKSSTQWPILNARARSCGM